MNTNYNYLYKYILIFILFNINILQIYAQNIDSLKFILPLGHGSIINDVIETSDNEFLITCSDDNAVNIWNLKTGKLVNSLLYHTKRVNGLDYDTLTKLILSYSDDNRLCLWNINSKTPKQIYKTTSKLNKAIINRIKNQIVAVTDDNYIYIWNLITGKLKDKIKAHKSGISNLVISNDGSRLITFDRNGYFKVWNTNNWDCLTTQKHGCSLPIIVKKYNYNKNIYFTKYDSTVVEYNPYSNQVVNTFTSSGVGFLDFAVSTSGRYLAVSRFDKWINIFDKNNKEEVLYKKKLTEWGYSISINPKENRISVGVKDGNILEFDIINEKEIFRIHETSYSIEKILYLNDGALIFSGDRSGKIKLIESGTGKQIFSLSSKTNSINSIGFLEAQNLLITGSLENSIRHINYKNWDYGSSKFEQFLKEYSKFEMNISVNKLAAYNYQNVSVFDYEQQRLLFKVSSNNGSIYKVGFNNSATLFYTINNNKEIKLYNANNGQIIDSFYIENGYDYISAACFSTTDSILYLGTSSGVIYAYNIETHKLVYENTLVDEFINYIFFDKYHDSLYVVSDHNIFYCTANLNVINTKYESEYITDALYIDDKNNLLIGKISGKIEFYQPNSDLIQWQINVNTPIKNITTLLSNKILCVLLLNGSIEFYDYNSSKKISTLLLLEKSNWLLKLANTPFFMCSKDASRMVHYVTPNLKIIGFDQLDPIYNRPDIVLDTLGNYFGGKELDNIQKYHQVWERRINRLELDKDIIAKGNIAIPEGYITNEENIPSVSKDSILKLQIHAKDFKYKLKRFNLTINEVPLYGSAGISISSNNIMQWDTTISIALGIGENKIQVSVINELGLENFKYPKYVNYDAANNSIISRTHFIGIGIDKFKDPELKNLDYCVKDVNDLGMYFNEGNNIIKIISNENVTKENILSLKQYLKDSTTINDRVIISCSSHGILDENNEFYLAMHDMEVKKPEIKGLAYKDLEILLDDIPARKKLLLLDACYSGENDKTEKIRNDIELKKEMLNKEMTVRSLNEIQKIKVQNQRKFLQVNELFINVRNKTGSIIISAAGGQQEALEGEKIMVNGRGIQNGAFTYSVLEYLKQNKRLNLQTTVNNLKKYVEKRVEEITEGEQKPTSRLETMEVDWDIK